MEELIKYLQSPEKNYKKGVEIMEKIGLSADELKFYKSESAGKMHFDMLLKKMQNVQRIYMQNPVKKQEVIVKKESKPIIVKRLHFDKVGRELEASKLLTNKLLSRSWDELDEKEKQYFKNNEENFGFKKSLLIENSKIESELKSLHASMKLEKSEKKRAEIAQKLVDNKQKQTENWKIIDDQNYKYACATITETTAHIDKGDLITRRNNLRARRSKLQKKLEDKSNPKFKKWTNELTELVNELTEVENQLK